MRVDFSSHRKVLVVGLGYRTGLAASNFLAAKGHSVEVSDCKSADELSSIISKLDSSVVVHAGCQEPALLERGFDCVVLSPGVPARIPLIREALKRGVPVISEIEMSFYFLKGIIIGITGTDGKSTTTALADFVLNACGFNSHMGGNIGIPLVSLADGTDENSVTVIELSSYQLETIETFRPHIAVFTNLTPDHLDRYDSLDHYFDAKMRITMNQTKDDLFIYNADDARLIESAKKVNARTEGFSIQKESGAFLRGGDLFVSNGSAVEKALSQKDLSIIGLHNVQNVLSALLVVRGVCRIAKKEFSLEKASRAAEKFPGLPHRMEKLGIRNGRLFINDSKATTVGAVEMALRSIDRPSVFIVGGRAKGDDYTRLAQSMKGKVRGVVLLGETRDEFYSVFDGVNREKADSLDDAVKQAIAMTQNGDAVILSPACASFDMFTSYEHRGDEFRASVSRIAGGAEPDGL